MRRIAVVIRSLAVGGAETQAVLMARALARTHDVRLVVTRATPCERIVSRRPSAAAPSPKYRRAREGLSPDDWQYWGDSGDGALSPD